VAPTHREPYASRQLRAELKHAKSRLRWAMRNDFRVAQRRDWYDRIKRLDERIERAENKLAEERVAAGEPPTVRRHRLPGSLS
jgi:hypothetical protein